MATTISAPGVYVEEVLSGGAPIAGVGTSTAGFIGVIPPTTNDKSKEKQSESTPPEGQDKTPKPNDAKLAKVSESTPLKGQDKTPKPDDNDLAKVGEVKMCTNFTEFKKSFGDFSSVEGQNRLAHAVYGFFRNGGTRCYVTFVNEEADIQTALDQFEAIDEIAIVAAPGVTDEAALGAIDIHCRTTTKDRVAILDAPKTVTDFSTLKPGEGDMLGMSDYAALYFPWIAVFDPASKAEKFVPPSGHIAGIYARVDSQRGVFKAPANEPVLGAVGLKYNISKSKQEILNPQGVNCIRNLNGNIRVWGARTWGGSANNDFTYINVRRLMNYLRESIDEGTQWSVFEPNSPELWAKIRRNVTAFLMTVWRSGALFGNTPEEAFYVKCDEETNPPETRAIGQVVTEIGVAPVRPAEFVIFRLSQIQESSK